MKFKYKDQIVTASSKVEAIKILSAKELTDEEKNDIFKRARKGDKSILKLPKESLLIKDKDGWNPVHYLAKEGVIDILDLPKSILMSTTNKQATPIHWLADTTKKEVIAKICGLPVELLSMRDIDGETPVHWLAWYGVDKKWIYKFPKKVLNIKDNEGHTAIEISNLP